MLQYISHFYSQFFDKQIGSNTLVVMLIASAIMMVGFFLHDPLYASHTADFLNG